MGYLSHFSASVLHFTNKLLIERVNPARVIVEIGEIVLAQSHESIAKQLPLFRLSHRVWMFFIPLDLVMRKDKTVFVRKDSPFGTKLDTSLHEPLGWSSLVKLQG